MFEEAQVRERDPENRRPTICSSIGLSHSLNSGFPKTSFRYVYQWNEFQESARGGTHRSIPNTGRSRPSWGWKLAQCKISHHSVREIRSITIKLCSYSKTWYFARTISPINTVSSADLDYSIFLACYQLNTLSSVDMVPLDYSTNWVFL